jgi:hypothetical protein
MSLGLYVLAVVLAVVVLALLLVAGTRALLSYLRFRGTRVITCPETKQPAAVEVNAAHAARSAGFGAAHLRLSDCTRWPERQNCGQECLRQIEASPEDCLLRTILVRWYQGQQCAYCKRPFGEIHWHDHKPALLSPDDRLVTWAEVPPEKVPLVLQTHRPVCWDCHVAEALRRMFPERVVDRDQRWFVPGEESEEKNEKRRDPWRVN